MYEMFIASALVNVLWLFLVAGLTYASLNRLGFHMKVMRNKLEINSSTTNLALMMMTKANYKYAMLI